MGRKKLNILEFACPMVFTAYANKKDKVDFAYSMFDWNQDRLLDVEEMSELISGFINGFRRWA